MYNISHEEHVGTAAYSRVKIAARKQRRNKYDPRGETVRPAGVEREYD